MIGDLCDTDNFAMWMNNRKGGTYNPAGVNGACWIAYEFDKVYELGELWVWNHNRSDAKNRGLKNVSVHYSIDGFTWTKLDDFVFAIAPGSGNYAHNTEVDFAGAEVKYVVITANEIDGNWGAAIGPYYGLSEVRFHGVPSVRATSPYITSGCEDVVLGWFAGRDANSHDIYLGTTFDDVNDANNSDWTGIYRGYQSIDSNTYDPCDLMFNTTYYWRIDEVNAAEIWRGDIWSFTTVMPVANAGNDQSMSSIPPLITLDGSGTCDQKAVPLNYRWSQVSGPVVELSDANAISPTFVPAEIATYVFELIVNNSLLYSEPDIVGLVTGNNHTPVAEAGNSRYAAQTPITLDGTGSYDPDGYKELTYQWKQTSGPTVTITDSNTAAPVINGFTQTDSVQVCLFELVVNDGDLTSLPDTVEVIIVPDFSDSENLMLLENHSFDPEKPTVIWFDGGFCDIGWGMLRAEDPEPWWSSANILSFYYEPDGWPDSEWPLTYYRCADMIIEYLSKVAPNYHQPIQTMGFSTGGQPAVDVGRYINQTFSDSRYNINRVTMLDAACRDYSASIDEFLAGSVDGEQCWVDNYIGVYADSYTDILNVETGLDHTGVPEWYFNSLTISKLNNFNHGVVAGAYWSVAGPGKNLDISSDIPLPYYFSWDGTTSSGRMDFYNEGIYPGKLVEPVVLKDPESVGVLEPNTVILTCNECENAVTYELLFGSEPHSIKDYNVISQTTHAPNEVMSSLPNGGTWWTIRAYDQYGSSIYADPIFIDSANIQRPVINLSNDKKYGKIQYAIDNANNYDQILVEEGLYYENINFKGKHITVRSKNTNDWQTIKNTIIDGSGVGSVVTFSSGEDPNCLLSGFTITAGYAEKGAGIYCDNTSPWITNCIIRDNVAEEFGKSGGSGGGIYCTNNSSPTISNCIIANNVTSGGDFSDGYGGGIYVFNSKASINNSTIIANHASAGGALYVNDQTGSHETSTIQNSILWNNTYDQIGSYNTSIEVQYSNIQNSYTGTGNIDTDPCFVNPDSNDFHLLPNSPCIDTGDPNYIAEPNETDLDGQPRVMGSCNPVIDMGVDESYFPPSWNLPTQCHADSDGNGKVNTSDWPAFRDSFDYNYFNDWNNSQGPYNPAGDYNRDGFVDLDDWPHFRDNFFKEPTPDCNCGGTWPPQ